MSTRVLAFLDLFQRADGSLGADWAAWTGNQDGEPSPLVIQSNSVVPAAVGGAVARVMYAATIPLPADQWAEAMVADLFNATKPGGGGRTTVALRIVPDGGVVAQSAAYLAMATLDDAGAGWTTLTRRNGAAGVTTIAPSFATPWVPGDMLGLEAEGPRLRVYRNRDLLLDVEDTVEPLLAAGAAGLDAWRTDSGDRAALSAFAAGSLLTAPVPIPPTPLTPADLLAGAQRAYLAGLGAKATTFADRSWTGQDLDVISEEVAKLTRQAAGAAGTGTGASGTRYAAFSKGV